jgi:beta-mannosidase
MTTINLSGPWQLTSADETHRTEMPIPGDVHTALKTAGIIPDPYFGRNENDVQWVANADWTIERRFTLDDPAGSWYLDITYLDTVATVFVNDVPVLQADNCFRRHRPDASKALKAGENTIRILFHSSIAEGAARQARQPFYIPYSTTNSPISNEHIITSQRHEAGAVDLIVTATLYTEGQGVLPVFLSLGEERVRLDCGARAGEFTVTHVFPIEELEFLWPSGSGKQALYQLTVEHPTETITRQIGIGTAAASALRPPRRRTRHRNSASTISISARLQAEVSIKGGTP